MRHSWILFLQFTFLLGCIDHNEGTHEIDSTSSIDTSRKNLVVRYAEGFNLTYQDNGTLIETFSFGDNTFWQDSILVSGQRDGQAADKQIIPSQDLRFACQSSTYLSFLDALESADNLCGLCGVQYVTESRLNGIITNNKVLEICQGEGLLQEALLTAAPDIYLRFPFQSSFDPKDISVNSLYIAEYLEKTALARLEWIKLFGVLLAKSDQANAYFEEKEKAYHSVQSNSNQLNKSFILNLPYNDEWYMPAENSLLINLIDDAGIYYFYGNEEGTENILHPKEQVWNDAGECDYWIIVASRPVGFTLENLIAEDPVYSTFKPVREKQVIFCNTSTVPYFTKGVLEPDVMLRDLLFATGQINDHQPVYFRLLD